MAALLALCGGRPDALYTMSDHSKDATRLSRRTVLAASGAVTTASAVGLSAVAPALAQNETTESDDGDVDAHVWIAIEEFRGGAILRVESSEIDEVPAVAGEEGPDIEAPVGRIVQYFNTGEESVVYLRGGLDLERGTLYRTTEDFRLTENEQGRQFIRIGLQRLENQDIAFDITEGDVELVTDSGGEATVRPRDFSAGALFRITSDDMNWVPTDVAQSGLISEYDAYHARYVGTDEDFLFFPQESAQIQQGVLYVMHDNFEFLSPEGNLVAASFRQVDEASLPAGDYIP